MEKNTNLLEKTIKDIRRIRESLYRDNVSQAISYLWGINDIFSNYKFQEQLTSIDTDFKMMKMYWIQGVEDSQRAAMFNKICRDIDNLLCDMEMERMKCKMPFYKDRRRKIATSGEDFTLTEVKAKLESFVSDFAMTELLPENKKKDKLKELHTKHQEYLDLIFDYILTIGCMAKVDAQGWTDIMTSPTIDATDRQLLIAALVINLQTVPQLSKMKCMMDIYKKAEDDSSRQPALVGWTLALRHEKFIVDDSMKKEITDILNSPDHIADLMSLQMQIFMAMNAEKDSEAMDIEINKVRMSQEYRKIADQIEGNDVDHSLDDVLNAGENNAQMDEWMEAISKLSEMRKKGADLFFSGFAQLKNMGFFSKPANWFVNFYLDHPDIQNVLNIHPKLSKFIQVFISLPLLPTDKYSFVMLTAKMAKKLPSEMLASAFDSLPEEDLAMADIQPNMQGIAICDSFTKLLYRFFQLFGNRECFDNPFETKQYVDNRARPYVFMANKLCANTLLVSDILSFCKSMYKFGRKEEIIDIIMRSPKIEEVYAGECEDFDFLYFWGAYCHEMSLSFHDAGYLQHYETSDHAIQALEMARELRPDMVNVKKRLLKVYYGSMEYPHVIELAEEMLLDDPDNEDILMMYGISLGEEDRVEEAEKVLFKLVYLYPDNKGAINYLPKLLVESLKFDQAANYAKGWLDKGFGEEYFSLYKWMAICCYVSGKLGDAVEWFAKYFTCEKATSYGNDLYSPDSREDFILNSLRVIFDKAFDDDFINKVDLALLVGCINDRIIEIKAQKKVED